MNATIKYLPITQARHEGLQRAAKELLKATGEALMRAHTYDFDRAVRLHVSLSQAIAALTES